MNRGAAFRALALFMDRTPRNVVHWLFAADSGPRNRFVPRWFFLRALGAVYFSAFLALVFQI